MEDYKSIIQLSESLLTDIFPTVNKSVGIAVKKTNIQGFVYTFNKYANYFGIDNKLEICHFLSQLGHESDQFNAFKEYASGSAYEGRKDLGNTQKGDGIRFKGRGPIQTTGRSNYKEVGLEILKLPFLTEAEKELFVNNGILNKPTLLEDPVWGTLAAFIYWNKKNLNELALDNNTKVSIKRFNGKIWYNYTCSPVEAITRKVNGGTNGLDDRLQKFNKLIKVI